MAPSETLAAEAAHPELDAALATLREHADVWLEVSLRRRIEYLKGALRKTVEVAPGQVAAALEGKGVEAGTPAEGEDWIAGPMIQARTLRALIETLEAIEQGGAAPLAPSEVRVREGGQVTVQVFPGNTYDSLLYTGIRAEVWMQPEVTRETLREHMGAMYRQPPTEGKVALVLGAGNVASIGPLDVVHKLFFEGQVVILKLNPVNAYLGPFIREVFSELIDDGFLAVTEGDGAVGAYLCEHPGVDEIHITGSHLTHDLIVWGPGDEGAKRRAEGRPRLEKRVTSELGNVSPIIVVPGAWSESDLDFQADHVVTQMTQNVGFNCNAARLLITHAGWPQRQAFLDRVAARLAHTPQRTAYYPGAGDRWRRFVESVDQAQIIGDAPEGKLPWALLPGVDPEDAEHTCFTQEAFCGLCAETQLAAEGPAEFLEKAVDFCNDTLWGTLSACVLVDGASRKALGPALEEAVAGLRYGTVGVNIWPAIAFALGQTTWGAFPGHTLDDVQSGIGAVHNTRLFDLPEKSVLWAPFRIFPKPPWFVSHKSAHKVGPLIVAFEAAPSPLKLPKLFARALQG